MHITISAPALLQALHGLNFQKQMHDYTLLKASDGQLCVQTDVPVGGYGSSRNLTLTARTTLVDAVTIQEEGAVAVDYAHLVTALQGWDGIVSLHQEGVGLVLAAQNDNLQQTPIPGQDLDSYPRPLSPMGKAGTSYTQKRSLWVHCPTCKAQSYATFEDTFQLLQAQSFQICLPRTALLSMIARVAWAADRSTQKPDQDVSSGLTAELHEDVFSLVAATNQRLAVTGFPLPDAGSWAYRATIPGKLFLQALRRCPKNMDVQMKVWFTEHQRIATTEPHSGDEASEPFIQAEQVSLSWANTEVTCWLVRARFPDFRTVRPQVISTRAECSTAQLLQAATVAAKVAQDGSERVQIIFQEKSIILQASRWSTKYPLALQEIPASVTGERGSVSFQGEDLVHALEAQQSPQAVLALGKMATERPCMMIHGGDPTSYASVLAFADSFQPVEQENSSEQELPVPVGE